MEIAISKDGSASAFIAMNYERAGRNERNYLKPVVCMGLIVDSENVDSAQAEILTRIRPANLELSDKLMEQKHEYASHKRDYISLCNQFDRTRRHL